MYSVFCECLLEYVLEDSNYENRKGENLWSGDVEFWNDISK